MTINGAIHGITTVLRHTGRKPSEVVIMLTLATLVGIFAMLATIAYGVKVVLNSLCGLDLTALDEIIPRDVATVEHAPTFERTLPPARTLLALPYQPCPCDVAAGAYSSDASVCSTEGHCPACLAYASPEARALRARWSSDWALAGLVEGEARRLECETRQRDAKGRFGKGNTAGVATRFRRGHKRGKLAGIVAGLLGVLMMGNVGCVATVKTSRYVKGELVVCAEQPTKCETDTKGVR
jgi:hypothetical protein